jgi:hypothetical protein
MTDEGRRALENLAVGLWQRARLAGARETKADREIASRPSVSRLELHAQLRAFARTLRAEYAAWFRQFCPDRFDGARAITQRGFPMTGAIIARNIALQVWKRSVTPIIRFGAATLAYVPVQLATACRSRAGAGAIVRDNWRRQIGAPLSKVAKARRLLPDTELAGLHLSRSLSFAGALLVCGALSTAGGVIFLSGKLTNNSRAGEIAFLSGNRAESSRESPIVWLHDGRPGRSIFVTRRLAGATWIEGLAIRGENASNQTLTGIQGTIKTDSGEEIKLSVSMDGSQGKQMDAQNVPSGSEFTLEPAFQPDATREQTGMPAEEFLSKYGGMIFSVSFATAGVQTTLIEYLSTSKLRAQLSDMN